MGSQMTKELGVYNEEEKISTPVGPERYRVLNLDPRSVTRGINRTPIQVECTPKNSKVLLQQTPLSLPKNETAIDHEASAEKIEQVDDSMVDCADAPESSNVSIEEKAQQPEVRPKVLETDIDDFVTSSTQNDPLCLKVKNKPLMQIFDVRSPSIEINRTPVLVECTPEMFALHSRIDSLSFCDVDVHMDDPSAIVSEDDQSSLKSHNQSSVHNWLDNVENNTFDTPQHNNSFTQSPRQVAKKQKELNALKKQLFFTPDVKEISKPKVRTPLGNIHKNQLNESPQQMMRSKQWKNIQDERRRLGILDAENTPPSLPPLSKISSAPGKIVDRKRTQIHWDEDSTMLI